MPEFLFHRFEFNKEAVSKLETASLLKITRLPEALFPVLPDVVSKMLTAGKMPVFVRSDHQPVSSVDFLKRQGCTYPELLPLPDFSGYPLLCCQVKTNLVGRRSIRGKQVVRRGL